MRNGSRLPSNRAGPEPSAVGAIVAITCERSSSSTWTAIEPPSASPHPAQTALLHHLDRSHEVAGNPDERRSRRTDGLRERLVVGNEPRRRSSSGNRAGRADVARRIGVGRRDGRPRSTSPSGFVPVFVTSHCPGDRMPRSSSAESSSVKCRTAQGHAGQASQCRRSASPRSSSRAVGGSSGGENARTARQRGTPGRRGHARVPRGRVGLRSEPRGRPRRGQPGSRMKKGCCGAARPASMRVGRGATGRSQGTRADPSG